MRELKDELQCVPNTLKHQDLHAAVLSIETLNHKLDELISNIRGEDYTPTVKEGSIKTIQDVALVDVLNEDEFTIRNFVSEAHEQISAIGHMLFNR